MNSPPERRYGRSYGGLGLRSLLWSLSVLALVVASYFASRQSTIGRDVFAPSPSYPSWNWFAHPIERQPWHRLPFVASRYIAVAFNANGQSGWAVGFDGAIIATADGGKTWTPQPSRTRSQLY